MKTSAKILIGLGALLVMAQAIRPMNNRGTVDGPNHLSTLAPIPADIDAILQRACYDCHSNATNYPWYANLQPIGWWLEQHVRDGKRHLNFSEFTTYPLRRATRRLEEAAEEVREHKMPLPSYVRMHPTAKLTEAEIDLLAAWAINTRRAVGAKLSAPTK
jgi:hypothetical protein